MTPKFHRDELPAALLDKLDADKDGFVSEAELTALWKQNKTATAKTSVFSHPASNRTPSAGCEKGDLSPARGTSL
jgi:hypothetical protein